MSKRSLLFCFITSLVLACSGNKTPADAGTGGGSAGGSGGAGGGSGGGTVPNDDQCDFGGPRNCNAGSACLLAQLDDGGIARRCLTGACDVVAQDCDGGLKCGYADGGRACLADGTLLEGQPCAGAPVGCKHGLACTIVASDGGSVCARFCRVDGDCGAPQRCYVTLDIPDTAERPLVCADPPMVCDPLLQNCASSAEACYPGNPTSGCYPFGTGAAGETCTFSNDCGKGLSCSGSASSTKCRQLCSVDAGAPSCDAGVCTRLVSSQTVGVCL
ncbi:MAG: hypothetical protein IPJ65_42430 [Archangiaceae bacterium]|nr:hypothetical protein [Archangiaceae bacterium]